MVIAKKWWYGICGTSYNGSVHNYYSCNGKRKHICQKKNVRKDVIEDIVVNYARDVLTDENIEYIAKTTMKLIEDEKQNSILSCLEQSLEQKEKEQTNLISSLKICNIDSVKQTIFGELEKVDKEIKELQNNILIEKGNSIKLTENQIKFFLSEIRSGDLNDIKYRKILIKVLINRIYMYDDNLTIILNIENKDDSTIKIPSIDEIESSFIVNSGQPHTKMLESTEKCTFEFFILQIGCI